MRDNRARVPIPVSFIASGHPICVTLLELKKLVSVVVVSTRSKPFAGDEKRKTH